jgi:hypothetical protein
MAHDDFSFDDETTFRQGELGGGVDLENLEARYADLFSEVIWDGVITADKRARLDRAAELFGLDRRRTRQLEQALQAAYEARHQIRVREETGTTRAATISLAPFAPPEDPSLAALQGRIAFLESESAALKTRVAELSQELEEARRSPPPEIAPSSKLSSVTSPDGDPAELHRAISDLPRNPGLYHRLFRALKRAADIDRRYCTAQVLVFLGVADADEQAMYDAHQTGTLIRPARSLTQDEWHELLFHPSEDRVPGEIFAAVAPASLLAHLATLPRHAPLPDPTSMVDLATSTIQAARCFGWAAAILGMRPPPLYVDPDYPGLVEMVLTTPPSSRLGKTALSGRSARELAFAAGRHLCAYREEHFVMVLGRSTKQLEDLFLAALWIGNPGLPMTADVRRRLAPIARTLEPLLDPPALERLRAAFLRFVEHGGRTKLGRWAEAAGKTAACAGLLLADDLGAARTVLSNEEPERVDELLDDLFVFATSERYGALRRKIGIAIGD